MSLILLLSHFSFWKTQISTRNFPRSKTNFPKRHFFRYQRFICAIELRYVTENTRNLFIESISFVVCRDGKRHFKASPDLYNLCLFHSACKQISKTVKSTVISISSRVFKCPMLLGRGMIVSRPRATWFDEGNQFRNLCYAYVLCEQIFAARNGIN